MSQSQCIKCVLGIYSRKQRPKHNLKRNITVYMVFLIFQLLYFREVPEVFWSELSQCDGAVREVPPRSDMLYTLITPMSVDGYLIHEHKVEGKFM